MQTYEERVSRELESYREERPELGLPAIFTYWAVNHLTPRLRRVMDAQTIPEFFGKYMLERLQRNDLGNVASIGCGDCETEIEIAKYFLAHGARDFVFYCYDISDFVLARAKATIEGHGLDRHFRLIAQDLNSWAPDVSFAAAMANHSLHHMLNLEHIFDTVKISLDEKGAFVVADMIGRNGHMRWPEALELVNAIWRFWPDSYKYNHLLHRFEKEYENWDCSMDGFEGIRAQDILPALVKRFQFERFLGFGNLPDIFIERTFGPNMDPNNPKDAAFIDFLEVLNTQLITAGILKPTQMLAVMGKQPTDTICDHGWLPQFCIRGS
jgi:SAM-dependent methyltransferase